MTEQSQPGDRPEYRHWGRIYVLVVIVSALMIAAMGFFSSWFTPGGIGR